MATLQNYNVDIRTWLCENQKMHIATGRSHDKMGMKNIRIISMELVNNSKQS